MVVNLNGEETNCIVEKVYSLRSNEVYRMLSSAEPEIPVGYDRELIYLDKEHNQHCILAFSETPFVPNIKIALFSALKKTGSASVMELTAADFLGLGRQAGDIALDHLHIKLHAVTEYLLEQRRRIPRDLECVVRYSSLLQMFAVNFAENKEFALIAGEMLHRENPRIFTDMEPGSISVMLDRDSE